MSPADGSAVFTPSPWLAVVLVGDGLCLLAAASWAWRRRAHLRGRTAGTASSAVPDSALRGSDLFTLAGAAFLGAVGLQAAATTLANIWGPLATPGQSFAFADVAGGAGFQFGLLTATLLTWRFVQSRAQTGVDGARPCPPHPPLLPARAIRAGLFTFSAALAVVLPVSFLWQGALAALDIEAPPQDLLSLFRDAGDLPSLLLMIGLAVIVAPITEELIFRVGLFRWLRTRTPRAIALLAPAVLFAAIHGNLAVFLPLAALAVILSLGYEHYGHPAVPMIAHALFNLNTVALLLAGFPT